MYLNILIEHLNKKSMGMMRISRVIWEYHENENVWNLEYMMPKYCLVDYVISSEHVRKKNVEKKSLTKAIIENITK